MYSNDRDDDSCGAAPGVMGWLACSKYPSCGCGGSRSYEEPEKTVEKEQEYYMPCTESPWVTMTQMKKIDHKTFMWKTQKVQLRKGVHIPNKQIEGGVVFLKEEIEKYETYGDVFEYV